MNPILNKHKEIYYLLNDNKITKDFPSEIRTGDLGDLENNDHFTYSIKQIIIITLAAISEVLIILIPPLLNLEINFDTLVITIGMTLLLISFIMIFYITYSLNIDISDMNKNTQEFIDFLNNYKTIYYYLNKNFKNSDLIKNIYPQHEFQINKDLTFDFIIKYLFSNKDKEHIFQTVLSPEQYKKNKIRTNELTDNNISIFNMANIYNRFNLKNLDLIYKAIKLDIEFKQLGLPNNKNTYTKFIKSKINAEINKEDFHSILRMKFHKTYIDINEKINFNDLTFLGLSEQMHILNLFNEFMDKPNNNQVLILNKTLNKLSNIKKEIQKIIQLNPYLDTSSLYKELKDEIIKIKHSNNIIDLLKELINIQQQVLNQLTNNVIHSKGNANDNFNNSIKRNNIQHEMQY